MKEIQRYTRYISLLLLIQCIVSLTYADPIENPPLILTIPEQKTEEALPGRGDLPADAREATEAINLSGEESTEELYEVLPDFVVTAEQDEGYYSAYSTSVSRINTLVKDTPISMSIVNEELLDDLQIKAPEDLALVNAAIDNEPNGFSLDGIRIRGFRSSFSRFNFFKRNLPADSYNIARIDIIKGANSLIFGQASPGGSVNNVPLLANFRKDVRTLGFTVGNKDYRRAVLNANQKINDHLAVRVMAVHNEQGYDNPLKYDELQGLTLAATGRLGPSTEVRLHLEGVDTLNRIPHRSMRDKTKIDDDNNDSNGYDGILSKADFSDSITNYEVPYSPDWVQYLPEQALNWIIDHTKENVKPINNREDLRNHYSGINRLNYGVISGPDKYNRRKGFFTSLGLDHAFSENVSFNLSLSAQTVDANSLGREGESASTVRDGYDSNIFGGYPRPNVEVGEPYIRTYWTKSEIDTDRFSSRSALAFENEWFGGKNKIILGWDVTYQEKDEAFYDQVPVGAVGATVGNTQLAPGAYIPRGRLAGNTVNGQFRAYEFISLRKLFTRDRSILRFNEVIESDIPALPFENISTGNYAHLQYPNAEWALAKTTESAILANSLWLTQQGQYLDGRLNALIGIRYDRIQIDSELRKISIDGYDPGHDDGNNNTSEVTYDKFNPTVGGLFWLTPGVGIFGSYARSIESPSGTQRTPLGEIAPPELGEGMEAGIRFDLLQGRLDGQFAFYRIIKENDNTFRYSDGLLRQIYTHEQYGAEYGDLFNDSNRLIIPNLPGRRGTGDKTLSEGLELDMIYNPLPGLSLIASYNYTLANEIEELHPLVENPEDFELFGRPDHRATLTGRYKFKSGPLKRLTLGLSHRFRSATTQTRFDLPYDDDGDGNTDRTERVYLKFGDEHSTSAFAKWSKKLGRKRNAPKVDLAFRVSNLFNNREFSGRENYGYYRESRSYNLSVKLLF